MSDLMERNFPLTRPEKDCEGGDQVCGACGECKRRASVAVADWVVTHEGSAEEAADLLEMLGLKEAPEMPPVRRWGRYVGAPKSADPAQDPAA